MGMIRCPHCLEQIPEEYVHCGYCGKDVNTGNEKYMLQVGTVLQDRYYIGASIGQGGFGITYGALDLRLDMKVAIKEYYPDRLVTRDTSVSDEVELLDVSKRDIFELERNKCLQEARTLGDFSYDPGVVRVSDIFSENETVYIVMEYLDGMTLEQFRRRNTGGDFESCYEMLHPIIKVLCSIHDRGLIHRDISPSNIMVLPDGRAKLLDFGSASSYTMSEEETQAEQSEPVIMRPGYSPYEQYYTDTRTGPWTDVYSFCATFYYMLTGLNPVRADDRALGDRMVMPSQLGISITPAQEAALAHGLAVKPEDRTRSMKQLEDEFEGRVAVGVNEQASEPPKGSALAPASGARNISLPEASVVTGVVHRKKSKGSKRVLLAVMSLICAVLALGCGAFLVYSKVNARPSVDTIMSRISPPSAVSDYLKIRADATSEAAFDISYSENADYRESEEILDVWVSSDTDQIYLKNTSSAGGKGKLSYMTLTPGQKSIYCLGKKTSSDTTWDSNYECYLIPMLTDIPDIHENMTLREDTVRIDERECYVLDGRLQMSLVYHVMQELQIFPDLDFRTMSQYQPDPGTTVTLYVSAQDFIVRRIEISMTDFKLDRLITAVAEAKGKDERMIRQLDVKLTADYTYGDEARLPESDRKQCDKLNEMIAEARKGKDVDAIWNYGLGQIWALDPLHYYMF